MKGKIEVYEQTEVGGVFGYSMDCSPGQDGGPLCSAEGRLLGVFSMAQGFESKGGENFYTATMIGNDQVEWINGLYA